MCLGLRVILKLGGKILFDFAFRKLLFKVLEVKNCFTSKTFNYKIKDCSFQIFSLITFFFKNPLLKTYQVLHLHNGTKTLRP